MSVTFLCKTNDKTQILLNSSILWKKKIILTLQCCSMHCLILVSVVTLYSVVPNKHNRIKCILSCLTHYSIAYNKLYIRWSTHCIICVDIYPKRCNNIQFISANCSTCFGWYHHPSSGAHITVSTVSGIIETVTATCCECDSIFDCCAFSYKFRNVQKLK